MNHEQKKVQMAVSEQKIFKMMLYVTFIVAGVFLLKNLLTKSVTGAVTIGICLAVFAAVLLIMRARKVPAKYQQLIVSMALAIVVFIISLNSGSYYSDDFPLYLAVIGMTGLYLRPKYTIAQMILCDILLILQYIIHPEKAESLSQFIMCTAIFTLAAVLIYLTIKRGRAFNEISLNRAKEAENLLNTLNQLGDELQKNFDKSSNSIEQLKLTNTQLDEHTNVLRQGSQEIVLGAQEVASTCEDVKEKVRTTGRQVSALTAGVHNVETALATNQKNIADVSRQMLSVKQSTLQVNEVFRLLEAHMQKISAVTEQLYGISNSTTMLALNASIEAARAGQSGAGFAVVASKVQDLAVDSNACSGEVASVVTQMQEQIEETTQQLADSQEVINASLESLKGLQDGFEQLTEQFSALYQNIESQNSNVSEVDTIFEQLRSKIAEVSKYTESNQSTVESIAEAMTVYKEGMKTMVDDTRHVHELSSDMIELAKQE